MGHSTPTSSSTLVASGSVTAASRSTSAALIEAVTDRIRARRLVRPHRIDGYRSFGTPSHVRITGRVLAGEAPGPARPGERSLTAVGRMARRFLSAEVADVTVEVEYRGRYRTTRTDEEGYFSVEFASGTTTGRTGTAGWESARARVTGLIGSVVGPHRWWPVEVLIVGPDVTRIIISDVDDTVLLNGTGDTARTVLATVAGSELTRRPVPGAPELYHHLCQTRGDVANNPVFYVSSSPWNLYDFLVAFFRLNQFPAGPLLLRDIGLNRNTFSHRSHRDHKLAAITDILTRIPHVEAVLVGDSSLQDATAFTTIIDQFPDRIVAAYLRDVGDRDRTANTQAVLDDWLAAETDEEARAPVTLVAEMAEIAHHLDALDRSNRPTGS